MNDKLLLILCKMKLILDESQKQIDAAMEGLTDDEREKLVDEFLEWEKRNKS